MGDPNIIDSATLDSLKELLGDAFGQLIETYLTDSEARVQKLKKAIAAPDYEEITHEAHGLKGSSRNLGIVQLGDICEKLEQESREGNGENFEQYVSAVEQQFAAVTDILKGYL